MAVVQELSGKKTQEGPASLKPVVDEGVSFEKQILWEKADSFYVEKINPAWWSQMPLGQTMALLSRYTHTCESLVEHLNQLFRIEELPSISSLDRHVAEFSIAIFQDWLGVAQQLGLMMLSVPLGVEINGRIKAPFLESFGPFAPALQQYSSVEQFRDFYSAATFRHLRLLSDQAPEVLLREFSFQAWAMLSLALPKGVTQRVHLTIDPDWVSQIQTLRARYLGRADIASAMKTLITPVARQLFAGPIVG